MYLCGGEVKRAAADGLRFRIRGSDADGLLVKACYKLTTTECENYLNNKCTDLLRVIAVSCRDDDGDDDDDDYDDDHNDD